MDSVGQDATRKPQRIQRRRTKGWRMPAGAVVVSRPSKWGNPFFIADRGGHEGAVAAFREMCERTPERRSGWNWDRWTFHVYPSDAEIREHLVGRDLACWCPLDQPCHADVLLEIANRGA